jgi:hypothetical protein
MTQGQVEDILGPPWKVQTASERWGPSRVYIYTDRSLNRHNTLTLRVTFASAGSMAGKATEININDGYKPAPFDKVRFWLEDRVGVPFNLFR